MEPEEINAILSLHTCKIIAPAGHGKTEMISQLTLMAEGKQLILTHTNAGVDALRKRMVKNQVPHDKFAIFTIAGFCKLWCTSFPLLSEINPSLNPLNREQSSIYYDQLYEGAQRIFLHKWAQEVLGNSFRGLIVDEYQDCLLEQHKIISIIATGLPVRVFGDPMQAIFQWAGPLIDMEGLLFSSVEVHTEPWRWSPNSLTLGRYISRVRSLLEPTLNGIQKSITFPDAEGCVQVIPPKKFTRIMNELRKYNSVAFITAIEGRQLNISRTTGGFFQFDEKQESELLYLFAEKFSVLQGTALCKSLLDFVQSCASHVSTELVSFIKKIDNGSFDFSRIKKHVWFGNMLLELNRTSNVHYIKHAIDYIIEDSSFNVYRKEAFQEMKRAIDFSDETGLSLSDSIASIRHNSFNQNRYSFNKRLSTRTVLAKGLEFDCVIVDVSSPLTSQDFYVAISRAKQKLYILSDNRTIKFKCNKYSN